MKGLGIDGQRMALRRWREVHLTFLFSTVAVGRAHVTVSNECLESLMLAHAHGGSGTRRRLHATPSYRARVAGRSRRGGNIGSFHSLAKMVTEDITIVTLLVNLFKVEDAGQIEFAVLNMFAEADGTSGDSVLAILLVADVATNLRINGFAMTRTLRQRRNKMTFSDELTSKTVEMLLNGCSRGTRMQAVSNGIPWDENLVASTLILQVEEKFLRHTRT